MILNCGVGEDFWESLVSQEIKQVSPTGNHPWMFTGRTGAEAEAPIIWPPDMKSQLIGKDTDAGKDWGQEEKGVTEDETVGWHYQFNWREFEQTPRGSGGQSSSTAGVLQSLGSQRAGCDLETEQQSKTVNEIIFLIIFLGCSLLV